MRVWTSQHTVSVPTMSPGPPATLGTPSVSFSISEEQFNISWDEPPRGTIDTYFVNISGPDDQCGNVDKLQRVTEHSYTCSGWTIPNGQKYSFTVQAANCGGIQRGPINDSITVCLQGMLRHDMFCILQLQDAYMVAYH